MLSKSQKKKFKQDAKRIATATFVNNRERKQLGKDLKKVRIALGLSVEEVAEALMVSSDMLENVEEGKKLMSAELMQEIGEVFFN